MCSSDEDARRVRLCFIVVFLVRLPIRDIILTELSQCKVLAGTDCNLTVLKSSIDIRTDKIDIILYVFDG